MENQIEPLQQRQIEVAQYQQNIDMFTVIADSLPKELPPHLEQYRTRLDKHATAAEITDLNDLELLSDVWMYDEMQARIRAEMVEMRKAKAILTFMESQA